MTVKKLYPLVTCTWLRQRLTPVLASTSKQMMLKDKDFRLLDTSWLPEPEVDGYRDIFQKGHIPSAVHFDLKKLSPKRPDSPIDCPIPDPNFFKDYVESLGITNSTQVVAYDSLNTRPSVRTWYLFKLFGHDNVTILNGGMNTWRSLGFPVTQEEPDLTSLRGQGAQFKVNFRDNMLLTYRSMMKIVAEQKVQIVDSRPSAGGFYVTQTDKSGGHMPGAKNVPFGALFREDGTFKEEDELRDLFHAAGVRLNLPMVATCQRGMTACGLLVAAGILDVPETPPVYNGSWLEWSETAEQKNIVREEKK